MRSIIALVGIILYTLVFGLLAILAGIFSRGNLIQHLCTKVWVWLILKTAGVKVKVKGLENIPKNSACVLMSNHQSHFDVVSLFSVIPLRIYFLAKKELLKIPVFGWAMFLIGHIFIDRSDRESAFKSIDQAAKKVKNGKNVMVFPEGTRSPDGELLPFKKGGFVLAIKSGVPVLPIGIYGSNKILPKGSLRISSGVINVVVGKPIDTRNFSVEEKEKLMDVVRKEIEKLREEARILS